MELPIDLISTSGQPRFRWRQRVDTLAGPRTVNHEGTLPPSVENNVAALVLLAREQAKEIEDLKQQIEGHCDRIARQSELLSRKAEATSTQVQAKKKV